MNNLLILIDHSIRLSNILGLSFSFSFTKGNNRFMFMKEDICVSLDISSLEIDNTVDIDILYCKLKDRIGSLVNMDAKVEGDKQ